MKLLLERFRALMMMITGLGSAEVTAETPSGCAQPWLAMVLQGCRDTELDLHHLFHCAVYPALEHFHGAFP